MSHSNKGGTKKVAFARASITIDTYLHLTEKVEDETVKLFESISD